MHRQTDRREKQMSNNNPMPLYFWPNEVSIAINLAEKLQKSVREKTGERVREVESVLQLDEIYRAAPSLEHAVRELIEHRAVPDHIQQYLDEEESDAAHRVLKALPAGEAENLRKAILERDQEEAQNSA